LADDIEQLKRESVRQRDALYALNDEIMSMLHARPLREKTIGSEHVTRWLRRLYNITETGLGNRVHFRHDNGTPF
jgi:hypothetical protein